MKTLKKLKLKEFHEMTDLEMRNVLGGYESGEDYPKCKYTCPGSTEKEIVCYGKCETLTGGEVGVKCMVGNEKTGSITCVNSPT